MKTYHLDKSVLWRIINAGLLAGISLFGIGETMGISSPGAAHALAVFGALAFLFWFQCAKLRGRILCLTAGAALLFGAGTLIGIRDYFSFFKSYVSWILGVYPWQEEWIVGYELFQVLFLALVCYLLQLVIEKDFRLKMAVFVIVLAVLLYSLFAERKMLHGEAAFILFYLALIFAEWTQRRWKKEKGDDTYAYMLWILPFFILYFLLMMLTPVPEKPYDWHFVRNIYRQIKESFLEILQQIGKNGQEDYDLSLSGFTESGALEGELGRDDREIMTIESGFALNSNVYLTGKVYDTFDGRQWLQENEDTSKERYLDTVETLYALRRYTREYEGDYLFRARLKINYRYFHSGFLFAPLKTWSLEQDGGSMAFRESGGSLFFEEPKGYGTEYEAVFYQMNAGQRAFDKFLQAGQAMDGRILGELLKDLRGMTGENVTEEDMERHRQEVYEHYLGEALLSPEAEAFVEEITRNAGTEVEKLRAIEAALASLTYTRTPGELPQRITDGSQFLDYFLLENPQGYCNYFATAFVLLARAEGLPARYVQGFCVPMKGRKEAVVYSYMAHAWPEVYLEGIGWIPFEPTPGFSGMRYTPWDLKDGNGDISDDGAQLQWQTKGEDSDGKLLEEAPEELRGEAATINNAWYFLRIGAMIAVVIIIAGILILILDAWIVRYRYKKMNVAEKFKARIERNMRLLALMGIRRESGETLAEFADRAGNALENREVMDFVESYEGFLYGDKEITKELVEKVKGRQRELEELLRKKNRWASLYYRIFSGAGR
ncbi:MAG: DUF3488 and transglutaminase-like domain-containing protein [Clostridium sp.]|nr:DUF3488 and transglutaminase-like domain-containing protein [Clostridium sp.]